MLYAGQRNSGQLEHSKEGDARIIRELIIVRFAGCADKPDDISRFQIVARFKISEAAIFAFCHEDIGNEHMYGLSSLDIFVFAIAKYLVRARFDIVKLYSLAHDFPSRFGLNCLTRQDINLPEYILVEIIPNGTTINGDVISFIPHTIEELNSLFHGAKCAHMYSLKLIAHYELIAWKG
jgi:hypothetical protein